MAPHFIPRQFSVVRRCGHLSFGAVATAVVGSAVALSVSLGASTPSTAAAELAVGDDAVVTTDVVNVRDDATTSGSVLTTLVTGDAMTVVGGPVTADGYDWVEVTAADGTTGWLASDYIALPSSPDFALGDDAVVDTDALNVRSAAGIDGTILVTLVTGDAMTVVGDAVSADGYTWYEVTTLDGTTGWVVGEYLAPPVAPVLAAGDAAIVHTDALNVRDDASVSGGVLATLATADALTVLYGPTVVGGYTWYQVEAADGTTGWVVGEYLAAA